MSFVTLGEILLCLNSGVFWFFFFFLPHLKNRIRSFLIFTLHSFYVINICNLSSLCLEHYSFDYEFSASFLPQSLP